jgi:YkoY family integral membrane protein
MALPLPFSSTEAALFPSLMLLETVLSVDNALALAALVRPVAMETERQRLLNQGMATAIGLRLLTVAAAGVVLQLPLVRLLGGAYLVWLALGHFRGQLQGSDSRDGELKGSAAVPHGPRKPSRIVMVLLLAGTNLAFSLDSLCAALALTNNLPLVMLSGTAGLLVLRAVTDVLLRWMERFPNLANAGYLTVLSVGLRLMVIEVIPAFTPSEPLMVGMLAVLFAWGLRQPQAARL